MKIIITLLLLFNSISSYSQVKIYKGNSTYSSDIIFTINDSKVYKGNSNYSVDILFVLRDGRLYKGNSSYYSDVICTKKDNKVYNANSIYSSDIQFSWQGLLTMEEFISVFYAIKYNY